MLHDSHGRRIEYLRLSVTDRCDLRCTYCMPAGFKGYEEPANWLTFDEIERVVGPSPVLACARLPPIQNVWGRGADNRGEERT